MRIHFAIVLLLVAITTAMAEPSDPPPANPGAREAALEKLLGERGSPTAFDAAIASAHDHGVAEQAVLEARFLYHVDRHEDAAIAAMLPAFLQQRDAFKPEESAIFGVKEDWLAVVEYVQALAALGQGDKDSFKKHITEAFWLSPRQAAAFAPHIERMRLDDCMRALKLDFSIKLTPLVAGEPVALQHLIAEKKSLLLHFWSPRSRECEASLPDFLATATTLTANNIAVASILPGDAPALLTEARDMIHAPKDHPPGAWLIDPKEKSLARELRIQNLPAMVLVSPEGKILFNGDPTEPEFWDALLKIDASIKRPMAVTDGAK
jgi:hypothetical protein